MKSCYHLTRDQRCQIYALKQRDFSQGEIAHDLDAHQSTISRELNRNRGCAASPEAQSWIVETSAARANF